MSTDNTAQMYNSNNQNFRILQHHLNELQTVNNSHKTLESELSKFKKLVEHKYELLKQMDKELKMREKINEKKGKAYEEIVKVKQKQAEDKIRYKKQQFKAKYETYEKRKAIVQEESEKLLELEKELRAKKDYFEKQLEQYEKSKEEFEREKEQYKAIQYKKQGKIEKEISQGKSIVGRMLDKNQMLEQKIQQLTFKEKNISINENELNDLSLKLITESSKVSSLKQELATQENAIKSQLTQLQTSKEIELLASEELKKTEIILFDKENREYESDQQQKTLKTEILHLKRVIVEKSQELACLNDKVLQKELELNDEEDRLIRTEQELEEDISCGQYGVNELKKKLKELEAKREEAKKRETIVRERLKIEGKIELELAGLDYSQEQWGRQKDNQQKQVEMEMRMIKERETVLKAKESELKKKEMMVRRSHKSMLEVKGIFKEDDTTLSLDWENKENISQINKLL